MTRYTIKPAQEDTHELVHSGLRSYNRRFVSDAADLSLVVEDETGNMIGGCDAFRLGDLAILDALWVAEPYRKNGLGSQMLRQLEQEASHQGATHLELNTFEFQAPGFYEKMGYHCFGTIASAIGNYCHYFYVKNLT